MVPAVLLGLGLVAASATPSAATFLSGDDLYARCAPVEEPGCSFYIVGVTDVMVTVGEHYGVGEVCIPESASVGQIKRIVIDYLAKHPDARQYSASSNVAVALEPTFPCP